jgi:hypothetical protein
MKTVETRWSKKDGAWFVFQGKTRMSEDISVKKDAIEFGREIARQYKAEHIIKNKDGTISFRNSYGNDPRGRG